MTSEMVWFRDVNTGRIAKYPARFSGIFSTLEQIDEDDAACVDCLVSSEPDTEVFPFDFIEDEAENVDTKPTLYFDETKED